MTTKKSRGTKIAIGVAAVAIAAALLPFAPNLAISNAVLNDFSGSDSASLPSKDAPGPNETMIDLGSLQVPVMKDGLYDRFRSNPPLVTIAEARPDLDLSWFKTLTKEKKDVGFVTYSPNFYYSNTSITAIYTADMAKLEALMPDNVKGLVEPISFTPGNGLVAITSYAYNYCDNDAYNELSIAIVTTKPDASNWGLISLMGEINDKSLWGYVLKLPVDTELARARGVVGYNLPKWLIPIKFDNAGDAVSFTYYDEKGNPDFSMVGQKLDVTESSPDITRSNFVNVDAEGRLTHGYSDSRAIQKASSMTASDVQLNLSNGPLSSFIKSLGLKKLVRYDYQPEFQAALYTPELIGQ